MIKLGKLFSPLTAFAMALCLALLACSVQACVHDSQGRLRLSPDAAQTLEKADGPICDAIVQYFSKGTLTWACAAEEMAFRALVDKFTAQPSDAGAAEAVAKATQALSLTKPKAQLIRRKSDGKPLGFVPTDDGGVLAKRCQDEADTL